MRKAIGVFVVAVSLVMACAPAAPTPTPAPEPTPTPIEVLATKPEHLAGIWFNKALGSPLGTGTYYRFEGDGTICYAFTLEDAQGDPALEGRFWFEDGVYYEESRECFPIGSYRAYLDIAEGRAVGLRFEEIDDSDQSCFYRRVEKRTLYVRVD